MAKFKSWQAYWEFEKKVRNYQRYIYDEETENFLLAVLESAKEREVLRNSKKIFWRAQLGHDTRPLEREGVYMTDIRTSFGPHRMLPNRDGAHEGRINPKGIPCLYLSSDEETAMAEVRPWIGSYISLAQIKINTNLRLVDCSKNHEKSIFLFKEPKDYEKIKNAVWSHIDAAYSKPVERNNFKASYAPTQILSELFKNQGYDGVIYKSSLGAGYNIALFLIDSAEVLNSRLHEVTDIKFEFVPAENPTYFKTKEQ